VCRRFSALLVAAVVAVVVGLAGPAVAQTPPSGSTVDDTVDGTVGEAPPIRLADLLRADGDQIVVVPDGTYEGVRVRAPHPETTGPLGGWLVLQAENPGGAVITGDLHLDEPTSRILFVGFRFEDARVYNHGQHLAYWYTDHVYPDVDWFAADRPLPRQFFVRYPATDIDVLGSDFHDGVASPINVSGVERFALTGVRVFDLSEPPGSDPEDRSHLNTISLLGGDVTDMVISRSSLVGARANHQTDHGDVVGLRYEDVWYQGAFGAAFQFNATNGNRIVDGERVRVRSWGHVGENPQDRIDIVDGRQLEPGQRPDVVDVQDLDVELEAPPADAVDPALAWRAENPYDSWPEHFGWTRIEPIPASVVAEEAAAAAAAAAEARVADDDAGGDDVEDRSALGVAVTGSAVLVVAIALGVLYLVRRRRRRTPVAA
jgi:hypothetical protein